MAILPIILYPNPVLKTKCETVERVTKGIVKLLDDMAETMYAAPGVGLAGPQVAVNKRVFVADISSDERGAKKELYQLVNPKVVKREGKIEWEEACLSIPGFVQKMERSQKVIVEAINKKGRLVKIEAEGLLAVCLQHEIDHLSGKLIIDSISRLKRSLYLDELKKLEIPYPTK